MSIVGRRLTTKLYQASAQKLCVLGALAAILTGLLAFSGCQPKSSLETVSGDVQVLIPKPDSSTKKYHLDIATLKGIKSLKEVRGEYVQFIYSPGGAEGTLVGGAPRARFSRNEKGVFLPLDLITTQMSAIYYHLQNLMDLNDLLGLNSLTRKPFQVGLEVKKPGLNNSFERNNAFYDGLSDSMLFLPNSTQDLALYLNAGVIAHEFFHSIFFKKVLGAVIQSSVKNGSGPRTMNDDHPANVFNLVWLRGVNEGLADFWGWAYTDDPDFMGLSLSQEIESRTLNVRSDEIGVHQRQIDIRNQVGWAARQGQRGERYISDFIYTIGTPHARFLKLMASLEEVGSSDEEQLKKVARSPVPAAAKQKWLEIVVSFLDDLARESLAKLEKEKPNEFLAGRLFQFVAQRAELSPVLNQKQCEYLIKYLEYDQTPIGTDDFGGAVAVAGREFTCQKSDEHGGFIVTSKMSERLQNHEAHRSKENLDKPVVDESKAIEGVRGVK